MTVELCSQLTKVVTHLPYFLVYNDTTPFAFHGEEWNGEPLDWFGSSAMYVVLAFVSWQLCPKISK